MLGDISEKSSHSILVKHKNEMIHILPYIDANNKRIALLEKAPLPEDFLWKGRDHLFFENAKGAIHYLALKLKLNREDDVAIFTSTDNNYVSTCVSATLFNYCGISRVITKRTKLIYVIHEFGIPHPKTADLLSFARMNGIPLAEDCAHAVFSEFKSGERVGTLGDYAIYSLSKHMPVKAGGVLVGNKLKKNLNYNQDVAGLVEKEFKKYRDIMFTIADIRKRQFDLISNQLKHLKVLYKPNKNVYPYFLIIQTTRYKELYGENSPIAEWGRTYIKNWFCVPLQPFANNQQIGRLINYLKQI